jgi:hypothetical protein
MPYVGGSVTGTSRIPRSGCQATRMAPPAIVSCRTESFGSSFLQHPDQDRPERPVLLAVDQQLPNDPVLLHDPVEVPAVRDALQFVVASGFEVKT